MRGTCLVAWLPLARYAVAADWGLGLPATFPLLSFLFAAAGTLLVACAVDRLAARLPACSANCARFSAPKDPDFRKRGFEAVSGAVSIRRVAPLAAQAVCAGCGTVLAFSAPAEYEPSATLCLSLACMGASFALGLGTWSRDLFELDTRRCAIAVMSALLVSTAVVCCVCRLAYASACLVAFGASLLFCASLLRDGPGGCLADGSEAAVRSSKSLLIAARQLALRYVASLFVCGFYTTTMLMLFALGASIAVDVQPVLYAPLGAALLAVLVALGWVRNHEPDFLLTLELTTLVAVFSFFPFHPGTKINQEIALVMGTGWLVMLAGCMLLVSREVGTTCAAAGLRPFRLGVAGFFAGLGCGVALLPHAIAQPWFTSAVPGAPECILFATACGAGSIMLSFICGNVLLNRDLLRNVRLLAQGKFATTLGLSDNLRPASACAGARRLRGLQASPCDSIERACRDIALQKGLTPREYDVLVVLAYGYSMARVQSELVISEGTAITHRRNLYRKLGVHSKQELIDLVRGRVVASSAE